MKFTASGRPGTRPAGPSRRTMRHRTRRQHQRRDRASPGQALEAVALNYAVVANPDATPAERGRALCWVIHIVGDIQPLHVSGLFSKDYPAGNAAATLSSVKDQLQPWRTRIATRRRS